MNDNKPIMMCGHAANGVSNNAPCCVICCNIVDGWNIPNTANTALEGRKAQCAYCNRTRESDPNMAFFEFRKNKPTDSYYCGCRGWD